MKCNTCQVEKSPADFYARSRVCKACRCAAARANRASRIEEAREYDRRRASLPHRVENARRVIAAWKLRHPDRRAAQIAVGNAVRDGLLQPPPVCELPGCDKAPEAHHPDYSAPLSVTWLCPAHHKQAHALTRRLLQQESPSC